MQRHEGTISCGGSSEPVFSTDRDVMHLNPMKNGFNKSYSRSRVVLVFTHNMHIHMNKYTVYMRLVLKQASMSKLVSSHPAISCMSWVFTSSAAAPKV